MGLDLNERADAAAGANFSHVNPKPMVTTTSRWQVFQGMAVRDWCAQALPLLDQHHIHLKIKCKCLLPQLWGQKGQCFYDLVNNDIDLFG